MVLCIQHGNQKNVDMPANIATEERPETSEALKKHRTRFPELSKFNISKNKKKKKK